MICSECRGPIEGRDLRIYLVGRDAIELTLECRACDSSFSYWVPHNQWSLEGEPVDLTNHKPAVKPAARKVRRVH